MAESSDCISKELLRYLNELQSDNWLISTSGLYVLIWVNYTMPLRNIRRKVFWCQGRLSDDDCWLSAKDQKWNVSSLNPALHKITNLKTRSSCALLTEIHLERLFQKMLQKHFIVTSFCILTKLVS